MNTPFGDIPAITLLGDAEDRAHGLSLAEFSRETRSANRPIVRKGSGDCREYALNPIYLTEPIHILLTPSYGLGDMVGVENADGANDGLCSPLSPDDGGISKNSAA